MKKIKKLLLSILVLFGGIFVVNAQAKTEEIPKNARDLEYKTVYNSYVTNTEESLDDLYMKLGDDAVSLRTIKSELEKLKNGIIDIKKEVSNISTKDENLLSEKENLLKILAENLVEPEIKDYSMVFVYNGYNINVNYDGYSFSASYSNEEAYNSVISIQTLIELYVYKKNGKTIEDYIKDREVANKEIRNSFYDSFIFGEYKMNGFEKDCKIVSIDKVTKIYPWRFKISSSNIDFNGAKALPYSKKVSESGIKVEIENPNTGVGIMLLGIILIITIYLIISSKHRKYYKI